MFFKKQTVENLRREELRLSELELVNHQARLDYYEAAVVMLKKRITRLRSEVVPLDAAVGRVNLAKVS